MAMEAHLRATTLWARVVGIVGDRPAAIALLEAEIRTVRHETLLEAARLVAAWPGGESYARMLRDRARRVLADEG